MASLVNLDPKMLASILNQLIEFKENIETQKTILEEKQKNIPHWDDEQFIMFQDTMRKINDQLGNQITAIETEIERVNQYIEDTSRAKDKFK